MLFPVIKIKRDEHTHIVGTNSHDALFIEGNAIHYLNLQSMVGTQYPEESGMYFAGRELDEYSSLPYVEIEMVTIEELIEIAEQNMIKQTESSLKLHESFRKYLESQKACEEKRKEDDVSDTCGMLF